MPCERLKVCPDCLHERHGRTLTFRGRVSHEEQIQNPRHHTGPILHSDNAYSFSHLPYYRPDHGVPENANIEATQIGVMSNGVFLKNRFGFGILGEIFIPLEPGINTFTLFDNGTPHGDAFYGAVFFFNGVPMPAQMAVYNANSILGIFWCRLEIRL